MIPTRIVDVAVHCIDMTLNEPFGISSGAQDVARNMFVVVKLADGTVGTGEAAPFPAVNGETREMAERAVRSASGALVGRDARAWQPLGNLLKERMASSASARCAVETAVLDALTRHWRAPLWSFFGGAATSVETDWTITVGSIEGAARSAARIANAGFHVIKLKTGGIHAGEDLRRVETILRAAPGCELILDANGAMPSASGALRMLEEIARLGGRVKLFEQPLAKEDHDGMAELTARAGVPIAADEGASSVADVVRIARTREASVVNIKITKSGVLDALAMIALAKAHGLGLMMGAMIESPLGIGMGACIAAGCGGFDYVDLDTAMWMSDPPVEPGYVQRGPVLDVSAVTTGHGGRLKGFTAA